MRVNNCDHKRDKDILVKMKVATMTKNEKQSLEKFIPTKLVYTNHALDQMKDRNFNISTIELLNHVNINTLLEIQVKKNHSVTFLFRSNVNSLFDIVFATNSRGTVYTAWLNNVNDNHKTLKNAHLYTNNFDEIKKYLH